MTDLFNPSSSHIENFDDDLAMTDRSLRDILPDHNCQSSDDQWNEMIPPNQRDIRDSSSSKSAYNEHPSTDLALSPYSNFPDFDLDSFLTSPTLTSLQTSVDTDPSDPATPRENFNLSTLPRVQGGQKEAFGNGSKTLPPSDDPPTRCQCLRIIGVLLEDLERKDHLVDPTALDSILASQKKAFTRCNSVLSCSTCVARSEYILLLGLITERLATLLEVTVTLYLKEVQRRSDFGASPHGKHFSRTSSDESNKVFLGRYEIESLEEWSSLIRVLVVLQLRSLWTLLGGMKKAAAAGRNVTQLPMVHATERRVGILIRKLSQPEAQRHSCEKT